MSETTFIYALKEPDTGEIRYIGKSDKPKSRLQFHLHGANRDNCHRNCWLRSLVSRGLKPDLEILDEVPEDLWKQWEAAYIEFFWERGCDLVNSTSGGDGLGSGIDHPLFGRPAWNKGKKSSEETRTKLRDSHLGQVPWNKGTKKIRVPRTGKRTLSEDHKRNISVATKLALASPEIRKKISLAGLGRKISEETRVRMQAAASLREARKKGTICQEVV